MTYVLKVNGRVLSEDESAEHTAQKVALHGGIPEILRCRTSAALETDTSFIAMHNSRCPLDSSAYHNRRREQLALSAKRYGLPDTQVMYDPTLAGRSAYGVDGTLARDGIVEGRSDWKKRIAEKQSAPPKVKPPDGTKRLHPGLVRDIRKQMISENPDVARRDQRELTEEIIDKHGST